MGSGIASGIINGMCQILSPFVGSNSQILSLVLLASTGVVIFLWLVNENKEGLVVWVLRTAVCVGILVNIFTLPPLVGLPSVCG